MELFKPSSLCLLFWARRQAGENVINKPVPLTREWTLSVRPFGMLAAPSALKCALFEYSQAETDQTLLLL
uniref:Uncharacterized protein n=1 Tax=Utricularia reniformis TaxID=192314 RepID=A0A1Y0B2B6_9LAMI|nr:hypothetical protein AEK19_MT1339 [Utricularia reniformis]ART31537.1 hypothetical protein AEK19_MT1339 [Utricularia reniformis]